MWFKCYIHNVLMSRILLRVQLPCLIRFNKNKKTAKHPTQQMQQNQRGGRRCRRMRCDNKVRDGRRIRRMRCNNKVRDGRRGRRMQMQGGWCRQNRSNLMVVRILSSHPTQQMRPSDSPSPDGCEDFVKTSNAADASLCLSVPVPPDFKVLLKSPHLVAKPRRRLEVQLGRSLLHVGLCGLNRLLNL